MQSKQINEGLKQNDLVNMISSTFSVDQYKSKVGDDKNVVVVSFEVQELLPAKDLSQFLETGHSALDIDVSDNPTQDGKFHVFVELERDSKLFERIEKILQDVKRTDNEIDSFKFTSFKNKTPSEWSEEEFNSRVYTSSYEYHINTSTQSEEISERIKFLNKY